MNPILQPALPALHAIFKQKITTKDNEGNSVLLIAEVRGSSIPYYTYQKWEGSFLNRDHLRKRLKAVGLPDIIADVAISEDYQITQAQLENLPMALSG